MKELRAKFEEENGYDVYAYRQEYAGAERKQDGFNDEYVEWLESKVNKSNLAVTEELIKLALDENKCRLDDCSELGGDEHDEAHEMFKFQIDKILKSNRVDIKNDVNTDIIDKLVVDVIDYSYKEWRDKYFEAPRIEQDVYFRTKSTGRKISQTQMIRKYQKAYGLI